jgi:hypothetical protein
MVNWKEQANLLGIEPANSRTKIAFPVAAGIPSELCRLRIHASPLAGDFKQSFHPTRRTCVSADGPRPTVKRIYMDIPRLLGQAQKGTAEQTLSVISALMISKEIKGTVYPRIRSGDRYV